MLLTDGSDHLEARPDLPALLEAANWRLAGEGIRLVHATLPRYLAAVPGPSRRPLQAGGEFRGSRRNNILPGVLSARMWIKQRNREIETLLTSWAEPFSAIAGAVAPALRLAWRRQPRPALLGEAWRLLLQNQPHDSICGCSVDQVHEEMRTRYDQAEQIGEELTRRGLSAIAGQVNTASARPGPGHPGGGLQPGERTGPPALSRFRCRYPPAWPGIEVTGAGGRNPAARGDRRRDRRVQLAGRRADGRGDPLEHRERGAHLPARRS